MRRYVVQCRDKYGFGMWLVNANDADDAKAVVRAYAGNWTDTYGLEVTWVDNRKLSLKRGNDFTVRGVLSGGSFFE